MELVIISGIILLIYLIYSCIKLKDIPVSISQTVRAFNHPWPWTAVTWLLAFSIGTVMLDQTQEGWQVLPFLYMFTMLVVGAAPWIKGGDNSIHNIAGIATCILSQIWVGITNPILLVIWIPYLIVFLVDKYRWCWWSEITSAVTTIGSIILLYR